MRVIRVLRNLGLIVLALFTVVGSWVWLRPEPGPVLYFGGPILTMDAESRVAQALATDGTRIVGVGREEDLRAWAWRVNAHEVDLGGCAILPGFVDAHGHFPGSGVYAVHLNLNSPPIGDVRTLDDVVRALTERAEATADGEWVVGMGYDDSLLAEKRHPTRRDLDRASGDHPVAVLHISGHLAVVNTAGLARMGIDRDTPDPEGGLIRRDAQGEPDGVLEETAMQGIQELLTPALLEIPKILRKAGRDYLAAGVTTAQSGFTPSALMEAYTWLSRLGLIPLRLVLWRDAAAADATLDGSFVYESYDRSWVSAGAVKLIADGSIQGYTGYLREPYHVPPGDDPSYRGYARIERDRLAELVGRYHAAGLQVAVHGNGDASIDDILDAFAAAQQSSPREDARHIVIHAQMARDDQLDRMKELGIVPSFFSLHTFYWGDRHRTIFMGPARADRMSPAGAALARGLRFTIHADAPVVPMEPLRLVWSAVNRRTRSGFVLGPEQRLTPMQALRAVTIDPAWQHFEEGRKGSLELGKLADLVILDRSPLERPEEIDRIQVQQTIIGGRSVYRAASGRCAEL